MNWLNNGQSVKVPVGNYRITFPNWSYINNNFLKQFFNDYHLKNIQLHVHSFKKDIFFLTYIEQEIEEMYDENDEYKEKIVKQIPWIQIHIPRYSMKYNKFGYELQLVMK